MAGAELVLVLLHDEENGRYSIEVADGDDPRYGGLTGRLMPVEGEAAQAFGRRRHQTIANLRELAEWPGHVPDGPAMAG